MRVRLSSTLTLLTLAAGTWLCSANKPANAQYGWPVGRYGFGGWSSTVQGDIAQGEAALAAGAGQYNQQTAVANSINANTVMQFNQYMYMSQQEQNAKQFIRQARRQGRVNATAAETADRLRNRPETADIKRGDALNVLLDDLTTPDILHSSNLRLADASIASSLVREIPFRNAAEAVTISIDRLTDPQRMPSLLRADALKAEREAFRAGPGSGQAGPRGGCGLAGDGFQDPADRQDTGREKSRTPI